MMVNKNVNNNDIKSPVQTSADILKDFKIG